MRYLSLIALTILYSVFLQNCASTPTTIRPEMQFGWVIYGNEGGNQIIIPNTDVIPSYNIYRYSEENSTFILVSNVKRSPLPLRFQPTPYGIQWVDEGITGSMKYKVFGLKDDGTEWFEVKIEYKQAKNKI